MTRKGYEGMSSLPATDQVLLKDLGRTIMKTAGIEEYVPSFETASPQQTTPQQTTPRRRATGKRTPQMDLDTRGTPDTERSQSSRRGRPKGRKNNRTLVADLEREARQQGNDGILAVSPRIKQAMAIERQNRSSRIDPLVSQIMNPETTQQAMGSWGSWGDLPTTQLPVGSLTLPSQVSGIPGLNLSAFKGRQPSPNRQQLALLEDEDENEATGGVFGLPSGTVLTTQRTNTLAKLAEADNQDMSRFQRVKNTTERLNILRVWKALQDIPGADKSVNRAIEMVQPKTATPA